MANLKSLEGYLLEDSAGRALVASPFSTSKAYSSGSYCIYNNRLYCCIEDLAAGAWDATKWLATTVGEELVYFYGADNSILGLLANEYDPSATYSANDFVLAGDNDGGVQLLFRKSNTWVKTKLAIQLSNVIATANSNKTKIDNLLVCYGSFSTGTGITTYAYSAAKTYKVGDYCYRSATNQIYVCTTDITTPESWTSSHWKVTSFEYEFESLRNMISDSYNRASAYAVGDIIVYDHKLYSCQTATADPAGPFASANWTEVHIGNILTSLSNSAQNSNRNIAASYEQTTYAAGSYCIYDGVLYRCSTAIITPEIFDPTKWIACTVGDRLKAIEDDIRKLKNSIATDYSSSSAYAVNSFCMYDGYLYRCNTAIAAPGEAWTASHWTQTTLTDLIGTMASLNFVEVTS